jgi:hypothetical protein
MEFENGQEDTVFCKAACGNNIHKGMTSDSPH